MSDWKRRRFVTPEVMDAPAVEPAALRRALLFIRKINHWLGYTKATIKHIERLVSLSQKRKTTGRPIRIVDIATGSADVPEAVLDRFARSGQPVELVAVDLHAATLHAAAELAPAGVRLVRCDALRLPFEDGYFDIATCSMFLHHLPDDAVVEALREMWRVSRSGVVVADLSRSRAAFGLISLMTLLSDPMIRHDARLSVRQAFTGSEMADLAKRAGLHNVAVHAHRGYRFVLTAAKSVAGG